ncbi:nucleotidyltransferase domain-containing protein [Candidatus Babeliales bacterium]|nr:nucleotidyltransferase domain-containing protein [Candidatus Babeliales bacterium]
MVKETYKAKLIELIAKHLPNAKIYLYGSRARNEETKYSDIDIAIDTGENADKHKMALIRLSLDDLNIPFEVDVVDLHNVSEKMQKNIRNEGVSWKTN